MPTANWYTCSCPDGIDATPPEYTCSRNDECVLYGCGTTVPEAACIEGGSNERLCRCPEGFMPGDRNDTGVNGTAHLIADEVFVGCVPRPPFLNGGQIAGIVIGSVAGAALWTGVWYMIGSAMGGGSGAVTEYVTL